MAFFDLSIAVILQFGFSFISEIAIHPEPVPISNIFLFDDNGKIFKIFSIINSVRQVLYRSNFLSSRNFDRFRNSLAWQTRLKYYVNYPKNLYNWQYGIWVIRSRGVYYRTIYANRSEKLLGLEKRSLITVTVIEVYDFLSSRLDELLYLLGDSIRFALGTTIGKFIGIFWRGIIEGLKT